ncbi:energy transducer TonB [Rhodanobacter sp. L36]|uniref:energy transducer TonB n=1 Tax=Rhodanobacter sp. L36 TaxID=1747221 RepID=UPI00131E7852|nr:energy transducer TonB [Rhodanobacter sp. L36]
MFRKSVAAVWLLAALFSATANAALDTTDPAIIHSPIDYPSSAVAAREEGVVSVVAEVDVDGRATNAKVSKSSGYPDLDAAALQNISRWSFRPATKDGKPVAHWVAVPINFQLKYDATGNFALPERALVTLAGMLLSVLGGWIWVVGIAWSVVLAKRQSILWLSFMVALWVVTYPLFVAAHWSSTKRNLMVVSLGVVLFFLGRYLAPSTYPSI